MGKIPSYPAKTTPGTGDLIVIEDVTAGNTKKMTLGDAMKTVSIAPNVVNTAAIADRAVTAAKISTTIPIYGEIGYSPVTANGATTTAGTPGTLQPGLSVTIISDGIRKVEIMARIGEVVVNATNQGWGISIWRGAVGSGTQIAAGRQYGSTTFINPVADRTVFARDIPPAGSTTYNIGLFSVGGASVNISASSINPSFTSVKLI